MYEKIWLAGLGAYARYEKLGQEGKKLFDELVKDGEEIKGRATDQVDDLKTKARERVNEVVDRLKDMVTSDDKKEDEVADLSVQIEELTKAVQALAAAEKKPVKRAAPRKAAKVEEKKVAEPA
ncbi:phasin family protein [Sansalvadorimonas sp. 2012CJ34-2]|uniref:Phasin family protein n=1 Tax=Parendozoicomonas callyspongiae TaxID=2942213 RepID=A0ABT0PK22_9GAMM|nr:phasin family protein [Sansalvadorimonas sp. 2012CJ34-2]MCL6271734.1 phasin family protein [Sansalvadorimonas sp. 2012CJ34-2]